MYKMNINRLDIIILQLLKSNECNNKFSGMTISEMLESCNMGCRNNVYIRLKKLLKDNLIDKGIVDNHADTYYITEKGLKIL